MREINLTIIGDVCCSTTRTYLTYLKAAGIKPKALWLVDFKVMLPKTKKIEDIFGVNIGQYFFRRQESNGTLGYSVEFKSLCNQLLDDAVDLKVNLFDEFPFEEYASHVERFTAEDYNSLYLRKRIYGSLDTAFLYTNGGIVPQDLLEDERVKIFHIHPGIVPQVRGSDCFLWSIMTRGKLGASCFYMSAGIDEGAILGQLEFLVPDLSAIKSVLEEGNEDLAYRAVLFAVDPHIRATVLVSVLEAAEGTDLRKLPCRIQSDDKPPAFLWIHPKLREKMFKKILADFNGDRAQKLTIVQAG